jgi:hypothetical protein
MMKQPILLICCLAAPAAFAQTTTTIAVHRGLIPKPSDILVNGPPYNALCNGTADDTAALNAAAAAANAAGGGTVVLPTGVCTTSTGIPIYNKVTYTGQGIASTTVAPRNGSNIDVFYGSSNGYGSTMVNYASGYQTGAVAAISGWAITDLTIYGNSANQQSGGAGIRQYGYSFLIQNVTITDTFGDCLYSDYNAQLPAATGLQGVLVNVTAYNCGVNPAGNTTYTVGAVGIRWAGPTDSQWTNIVTYGNASHGIMIGPNGGGTQIASLHSFAPPHGNNSAAGIFEGGSNQCSNCEFEGSDTVQLVMLGGGNESFMGGHIFQPTVEPIASVGIQLGQNAGMNTYAGVYWQQTPGNVTPAPGAGVAASTDGDFISTRFDSVWNGALNFVNEQNGQYMITTYTTTGAYVQGTPAGTDNWNIAGTGLTCMSTLATCGGTRLLSGNGNAFTITANTPTPTDLLNFNSANRILDLTDGSAIQLFTGNYQNPTYGLGVNGHGLSYNGGASGYIDAFAVGGWIDAGGWAYSPTSPQAIGSGATHPSERQRLGVRDDSGFAFRWRGRVDPPARFDERRAGHRHQHVGESHHLCRFRPRRFGGLPPPRSGIESVPTDHATGRNTPAGLTNPLIPTCTA